MDDPNLQAGAADRSRRSDEPRHERFMARAIALAELGRGDVSPNPMVGCVIVRDDRIVGEGWHRRAGTPHAEVHALDAAGDAAAGATAYVTLEPCDHHGRTPPCSQALIAAGVRHVVVAAVDPDPRVRGAGVRRLREAGVEVTIGPLQDRAEAQNEAYLTSRRRGRPYVLYKTAMTLDGRIATRTGDARWVSGEAARARVQRWRDELDAVVVGSRTVLADDPLLTARTEGGRTPRKVVFDSFARTPPQAALFRPDATGAPARVLIIVGPAAPEARLAALREAGAETLQVPGADARPDVRAALERLGRLEVGSVLLEGGGTLAWSFFAADAVDRVAWFVAPKLLGGGPGPLSGAGVARMADAVRLVEVRSEPCGDDLLITGRVPAGALDEGASAAGRTPTATRAPTGAAAAGDR